MSDADLEEVSVHLFSARLTGQIRKGRLAQLQQQQGDSGGSGEDQKYDRTLETCF